MKDSSVLAANCLRFGLQCHFIKIEFRVYSSVMFRKDIFKVAEGDKQ
jgi:hypothetical protein